MHKLPLQRSLSILLATAGVLVPLGAVDACNVPVFRYALERWDVDPYVFTLLHEGPLTKETQALASRLKEQRLSDEFLLRTMDVTADLDDDEFELKEAADPKTYPWLYIQYPKSDLEEAAAYSGPFQEEELTGLLLSPMRRKIAEQLLAGESIVWLLVKSGIAEKDDALRTTIQENLKRLEQELKLPKLDASDAQYLTSDAGPDLRLSFTLNEMGREEPDEKIFLSLLDNWSHDRPDGQLPMVVAFFGRGRVLGPLIGDGIQMSLVEEACHYLTGACSCQIKIENPGWDMLVNFDWAGALAGRETLSEAEPRLTTADAVAQQQQEFNAIAKDIAAMSQTKNEIESGTQASGLDFIPLVLVAIVLAVGFVGAASGVISQRNRERPPA